MHRTLSSRMESGPASLAVREMQIKTTTRYHPTRVRMAVTTKSTSKRCWRGRGERGTLVHCGWERRLGQPLWKAVWDCLRKRHMGLPYGPVIPLLGIYAKKPKTLIRKNIFAPTSVVNLWNIFAVTDVRGQPKCPSADKRIKKL